MLFYIHTSAGLNKVTKSRILQSVNPAVLMHTMVQQTAHLFLRQYRFSPLTGILKVKCLAKTRDFVKSTGFSTAFSPQHKVLAVANSFAVAASSPLLHTSGWTTLNLRRLHAKAIWGCLWSSVPGRDNDGHEAKRRSGHMDTCFMPVRGSFPATALTHSTQMEMGFLNEACLPAILSRTQKRRRM
jgi:hypothetical protein